MVPRANEVNFEKKVSLKSGRFYSSERVFAVSNNSNLRID